MLRRSLRLVCLCFCCCLSLLVGGWPVPVRAQAVTQLASAYCLAYKQWHQPEIAFDYRQNLRPVPPDSSSRYRRFLRHYQRQLQQLARAPLARPERLLADHLAYELQQQLTWQRLVRRPYPAALPAVATGLTELPHSRDWYAFYARRATDSTCSPDALFAFGQQQVQRAQQQIRRLRGGLGYAHDSAGFYQYLAADSFWLRDTAAIVARYRALGRQVQHHLPALFADTLVPALPIRPWPGATAAMPPAIYLADQTPPVFAFNFATGHLNSRTLAWCYLHEAVPGHHYQFSVPHLPPSPLAQLGRYYPGPVEGWGCYVEYLGPALGAYPTPLDELGHWEWDLVRSARVVLDVGIHVRGWSPAQALAYWQAAVPGQPAIAEREIRRVTQWPGQCLSYKVGAARLEQLRARLAQQPGFDVRRFHAAYLALTDLPFAVIERQLVAQYRQALP